MEDEMIDLIDKGSQLEIKGQKVQIIYEIEGSQFDNSTLKKIHGCVGAYCKECDHNGNYFFETSIKYLNPL